IRAGRAWSARSTWTRARFRRGVMRMPVTADPELEARRGLKEQTERSTDGWPCRFEDGVGSRDVARRMDRPQHGQADVQEEARRRDGKVKRGAPTQGPVEIGRRHPREARREPEASNLADAAHCEHEREYVA